MTEGQRHTAARKRVKEILRRESTRAEGTKNTDHDMRRMRNIKLIMFLI
jgi:hypothetical protein